jgi:hypothetical protein
MKQILTLSLFCLGILLFIVTISFLTRVNSQEPFLTGFVELNYKPPGNSLSDQQQTYVNVNILKQAVVAMNSQIEKNTADISNLNKQVITLTNQQSDLVTSNAPVVKGLAL